MKTLYLHIGTPKTATSSIQKFLSLNREALMGHGYCFPPQLRKYPYISSGRNGHFLVETIYFEYGARDHALEKEILKEGMDQVAGCMETYDNVVLSEENLWRNSSYSKKDIFPYLKQEAEKQGYQVKVIVYLRRQDQFMMSNWNQCVKQGKMAYTISLEEYIKNMQEKHGLVLDYAAKLDQTAQIFGKENLIVRRFDPESWVRHSIYHDFMDCIGLELTEEFLLPAQMVNPGLTENHTEIKRIINKDVSFSKEDNAYLSGFLTSLSARTEKEYFCSMLSPEETRALLGRYASGNLRVASEYIGDGKPLFSEEVSGLPKWDKDNPYMDEDMIRFFAAVSIGLHRENEELKQELLALRQAVQEDRQNLRKFKEKLRHPLHTLWNQTFQYKKKENTGYE